MRKLNIPIMSHTVVYADCVAGVKIAETSNRLNAANKAVNAMSELYSLYARSNRLHMLIPCGLGAGEQVILSDITKSEFVSLYSKQMSGKNGSGRSHYNKLRMVNGGICPFCGIGHVSTLDHFLAKSRYPAFSVLPINLVPSCADCNGGKGSGIIDYNTEMSHPYFEDSRVETERWLVCDVVEKLPVTVVYRIQFPRDWGNPLSLRVKNYFTDLKIASRYAVQAASYLVSVKDYLSDLDSVNLESYINRKANSYKRPNEWDAALYAGLARSDWFMKIGYLG